MQPRFTLLYLLLTLSQSAQAAQGTAETTACVIEKSVWVTFSSLEAKDRLEIKAGGDPCMDGMFEIRILAGGKRNIFTAKIPIKYFYLEPYGVTLEGIADQMGWIIDDAATTSGAWPPYVPKNKQFDAIYYYEVTAAEYEALRKKNLPALRIDIHREAAWNLIYDADTGKAAQISEETY